jgi:2-deoxy-D-gluconate 3-dehydrogenase
LPTLDILVNNAGVIRRSAAEESSDGDWDDVTAAAGRQMLARGAGKIINIASPAVVPGWDSRAGLRRGVNVNAIAPGYMVPTTRVRCARTRCERGRMGR